MAHGEDEVIGFMLRALSAPHAGWTSGQGSGVTKWLDYNMKPIGLANIEAFILGLMVVQ